MHLLGQWLEHKSQVSNFEMYEMPFRCFFGASFHFTVHFLGERGKKRNKLDFIQNQNSHPVSLLLLCVEFHLVVSLRKGRRKRKLWYIFSYFSVVFQTKKKRKEIMEK